MKVNGYEQVEDEYEPVEEKEGMSLAKFFSIGTGVIFVLMNTL